HGQQPVHVAVAVVEGIPCELHRVVAPVLAPHCKGGEHAPWRWRTWRRKGREDLDTNNNSNNKNNNNNHNNNKQASRQADNTNNNNKKGHKQLPTLKQTAGRR
ncbi:unnamed protein product, partial [Polarella glacialis]